MAQWVCQVLLPCLPREAFLRSRMGRLAVVSLLPPPGGRTAFVQEQTDQRASALPACWPWPWPSAHRGPPPPLSPLRAPPPAAGGLPALDTVSTHSPEAELEEKQKELPGSPWLWPAPSYQG